MSVSFHQRKPVHGIHPSPVSSTRTPNGFQLLGFSCWPCTLIFLWTWHRRYVCPVTQSWKASFHADHVPLVSHYGSTVSAGLRTLYVTVRNVPPPTIPDSANPVTVLVLSLFHWNNVSLGYCVEDFTFSQPPLQPCNNFKKLLLRGFFCSKSSRSWCIGLLVESDEDKTKPSYEWRMNICPRLNTAAHRLNW